MHETMNNFLVVYENVECSSVSIELQLSLLYKELKYIKCGTFIIKPLILTKPDFQVSSLCNRKLSEEPWHPNISTAVVVSAHTPITIPQRIISEVHVTITSTPNVVTTLTVIVIAYKRIWTRSWEGSTGAVSRWTVTMIIMSYSIGPHMLTGIPLCDGHSICIAIIYTSYHH